MNWIKETFTSLPPKPKGWVTVNEIVEQTGNNRKTVEWRLADMVSKGELEKMVCKENGRKTNCYRKVEKKAISKKRS